MDIGEGTAAVDCKMELSIALGDSGVDGCHLKSAFGVAIIICKGR